MSLLVSGASALALMGLLAPPAQAHTDLVSSNPADGATLGAAPSQVVLTFNEDVQSTGTDIVVSDADDIRIDQASGLQVEGATVSVPVDATAQSGDYTVAYRVVSADGHVVEGTLRYSVALPGQASPTPSASESATPAEQGSDQVPGWAILFAFVGIAAALLGVVVGVARRARG